MTRVGIPRRVQHRTIRFWSVALMVFAIGLLTGCGDSTAGALRSTPAGRIGTGTDVRVIATQSGHPDALYVPNPIRIHVGQTVTWTNSDADPHDVSADNGAFYSGPIGMNGTWRWRAKRPRTYPYSCTLHPEMHGTVIVIPAS